MLTGPRKTKDARTGDPLQDAWTKHARALRHIQELNAACGRLIWGEPKPYRVTVAHEDDAECHVARFVELCPPDPALGAMVGDIAHNLRGALDAAAWQLAVAHDRKLAKADRRRVAFPLARGEKAFRRHDALTFFSDDARWVIERVQPYHEPSRRHLEPLRLLSTLATTDTHRVVSGHFASLDFSGVVYRPDDCGVISVEDFTRPERRSRPVRRSRA